MVLLLTVQKLYPHQPGLPWNSSRRYVTLVMFEWLQEPSASSVFEWSSTCPWSEWPARLQCGSSQLSERNVQGQRWHITARRTILPNFATPCNNWVRSTVPHQSRYTVAACATPCLSLIPVTHLLFRLLCNIAKSDLILGMSVRLPLEGFSCSLVFEHF